MIYYLLFGLFMFGAGWAGCWLYCQTGGRHMIEIDPGLSPVDRKGNRMVAGEMAAPVEFISGAGYLEDPS